MTRHPLLTTALAGGACIALTTCTAPSAPPQFLHMSTATDRLSRELLAVVRSGPGPQDTLHPAPPALAPDLVTALKAVQQGQSPPAVPGYTNRTTGQVTLYVEKPDTTGRRAGHGTYVVRRATHGTQIQIPHPIDDRGTLELGLTTFSRAKASLLLISGSDRLATGGDVAKEEKSTFTRVAAGMGSAHDSILQLHGFAAQRHRDIKEDTVVSTTTPQSSNLSRHVVKSLHAQGISSCVYDGRRCASLAGTRNVQAKSASQAGADLVHVEISSDIRREPKTANKLACALADSLSTT